MTIRSALTLAFFAFALMKSARADDLKSISLTGNWQGSYTCAQGHTGLTLIIDRHDGRTFSGFFHFYAGRDNIMVPEGCFTVSGRVVSASTVEITGSAWIKRPLGYLTVDLRGPVTANGTAMSGAVATPGFGNLCTRFELTKVSSKPSIPDPCQREAPMVSYLLDGA